MVDLNEFSSIFQKVQHSHSRYQKTTSNLIRINFERQIKVQQNIATRGRYVHNSMVRFRGHPENVSFMQFSQNIDGFRQNAPQSF